MSGVGAAALLLVVIVAVLGAGLTNLPIDLLRAGVGGLLLIFGLQWLRKAILRAARLKDKHDESQAYRREVDAARSARGDSSGLDGYAFAVSFKGVLLEGLEVAFIVVTFGANQHRVPLAAAAAALAVVLVIAAGVAARAPLARVPENTMKFVVGVMLSSFGLFWGAEGVGAHWPGGEAALLVIIPGLLLVSVVMSRRTRAVMQSRPAEQGQTTRPSGSRRRIGATWAGQRLLGVWEFVVGEDWRTAVGVVLALTVTGVLTKATASVWWIMPLAVIGLLARSVYDVAQSASRADVGRGA